MIIPKGKINCDLLLTNCSRRKEYADILTGALIEVKVYHVEMKTFENSDKAYGEVILMAQGSYSYSLVVSPFDTIFPAITCDITRKSVLKEFL